MLWYFSWARWQVTTFSSKQSKFSIAMTRPGCKHCYLANTSLAKVSHKLAVVYRQISIIPYSYAVSSKIEPFYKGGKVQVGCPLCVVCC